MEWIKRNLFFLSGGVIALVLMGLASWYFYTKWHLNNEILEKLNADYAELTRLNQQNPHPGSGPVDNTKAAREQQQQLQDTAKKIRQKFQLIPAIPDGTNITDEMFSAALSRTIDQMWHEATNLSVTLPPRYRFSFEAENARVSFARGSLPALSTQLGEVRALCGVLFRAKVNSLDNVRRERVSADDASGPQTDYLAERAITNELAVMSPYELSFHCFSPELASVLAGFASSSNGIVIKSMNVERMAQTLTNEMATASPPTFQPQPQPPPVVQPPNISAESADAIMRRRYGLSTAPAPQTAPAPVPTAPAASKALPIVLDETQLRVTLQVNVIKLNSMNVPKGGKNR
jgi:hypothetical protein